MFRIVNTRRAAHVLLWIAGCAAVAPAQGDAGEFGKTFGSATPEKVGLSSGKLCELTTWLGESQAPIYSLLISRNGQLVYELYTSGIDREQAHYVMSVTKTVLAALLGIAIGDHLLPGPDAKVAKLLPRHLFASDQDVARFDRLTISQVLGMAALDAPVSPHDPSPAAVERQRAFLAAPNRVEFALRQALLPPRSAAFQYNDITPMLAVGVLQYSAGTTALEYAEQHLFAPLGIRNAEWMHQDPSGIDNGGYGLRLRPIDMNKFGVLFLKRGVWEGRQVVPKDWVELSFTPWNRSKPDLAQPNYGCCWWTRRDARWTRHEANGWKGQRIAVIPEPGLVVSMTGCIDDGSEEDVFRRIVDEFLPAAVCSSGGAVPAARAQQERLQALLQEAQGWKRVADGVEARMVPAATAKETRRPFAGAGAPAGR